MNEQLLMWLITAAAGVLILFSFYTIYKTIQNNREVNKLIDDMIRSNDERIRLMEELNDKWAKQIETQAKEIAEIEQASQQLGWSSGER